jgi:hypothetical protein
MRKLIVLLIVLPACFLLWGFSDSKSNAPKPDLKITKGGTMRILSTQTPQVIGYPPEFGGPVDATFSFPGLEQLMTFKADGTLEPYLCKKVDIDPAHLSITFHLHKGILFHDGSELTAEVARWVGTLIMRIIDGIMCFPILVLAIFISTMLGGGIRGVVIAMGFGSLAIYTRLMNGLVLSIKEKDYFNGSFIRRNGNYSIYNDMAY